MGMGLMCSELWFVCIIMFHVDLICQGSIMSSVWVMMWNTVSLASQQHSWFSLLHVRQFPPSQLPTGTISLSYSVSLASLYGFEVDYKLMAHSRVLYCDCDWCWHVGSASRVLYMMSFISAYPAGSWSNQLSAWFYNGHYFLWFLFC